MKAKDIMTKDPVCCTPDMNLQEVARMMVVKNCGSIPVVSDMSSKRLLGTITDRDIVCRTVAEGKNPLTLTAKDCMSAPCVAVRLETSVAGICDILEKKQIRRVAVVDALHRCCGIVAQADIAERASKRDVAKVVRKVSMPASAPSNV